MSVSTTITTYSGASYMIIPYQFGYCNIWGSIIRSGSTLSAKLTNDCQDGNHTLSCKVYVIAYKNIIVILSLQHKMSIL